MSKVRDQIFCYPRLKMLGKDGFCRIRVFDSNPSFIVITNIDASPGSVTNDMEMILQALLELNFITKHTKIIEHYEKGLNGQSFDLFEKVAGKSPWTPLSVEQAVSILKCDISEFSIRTCDTNHLKLEVSLLSRAVNTYPICTCNLIWRESRLAAFKESLNNLVLKKANERKIQEFIKKADNLDCLAQYYAQPVDEYIVFSEFQIGDRVADFVILSGRSRLEVHVIEIKGADFSFMQSSGGQGFKEPINTAMVQIDCHRAYISMYLQQTYKMFHDIIRKVLSGKTMYNSHIGTRKEIYVDPDKDVLIYYHVIGGISKDDIYESKMRHTREMSYRDLSIDSWNSFIKKIA